jgi:glycine betaine/proline transport system permease protein
MFGRLPIGQWGEAAFSAVITHAKLPFDYFALVTVAINGAIKHALLAPPSLLAIAILAVVAWTSVSLRFAVAMAVALALLGNQGLWDASMTTLAMVLTATILSMAIAVPLGIAIGTNKAVRPVCLPVLDFIQTMPRFVYLIPAVILLGIDVAPAVFATMTLAVPGPARLIATGLMEVDSHIVEAGRASGCSPWQLLLKIQLPLAVPSILLGLNQCIMMALSMTVNASLIGAGGLGSEILTAISSLDAGQGLVAGFGIFILAILLDRITQGFARSVMAHRHWAASA